MKKVAIKEKLNQLKAAEQHLNSELLGLESQVSKLSHSFKNWCCFQEEQKRPVVLNLWGAPGTGKTLMVREMVRFLGLEKRFFEMDCKGLDHFELISKIQTLAAIDSSVKVIFLLDNFQGVFDGSQTPIFGLPSSKSRLWNLLGEGVLKIEQPNAQVQKIREIHEEFQYWFKNGLIVQHGLVSENCTQFFEERGIPLLVKKRSYMEGNLVEGESSQFVFSRYEAKTLFNSRLHDCRTYPDFIQYVKTFDENGVMKFLDEMLLKSIQPQVIDLSQSIFIIVGTLPEVFFSSFHLGEGQNSGNFIGLPSDSSSKTIIDFLSDKLSPELVSRLGSTHILFPPLGKNVLLSIMERELSRFGNQFQNEVNIPIEFDQSIIDLIFEMGADSFYGARPLLSAIHQIIGNMIPEMILAIQAYPLADQAVLSYLDNSVQMKIFQEGNDLGIHFFPLVI